MWFLADLDADQKSILKALSGLKSPAGCREIGEASSIPWRTVMSRLRGLKKEGLVESLVDGKYVISSKGKAVRV